ncbi:MAG: hypothetical protein DMG11_11835 [Acidobacteria bacterium]|nr:MAG: hypothetical protein DMG11_11835 [Acidobacteriota bacterium]
MKPDFAAFMAVQKSRIMPCGCREQVPEWSVRVRQPRPEVCGRTNRREAVEEPHVLARLSQEVRREQFRVLLGDID